MLRKYRDVKGDHGEKNIILAHQVGSLPATLFIQMDFPMTVDRITKYMYDTFRILWGHRLKFLFK